MNRFGTTLAAVLGLLLGQAAYAQQCCGPTQEPACGSVDCCGRCGCHAPCQKVCKLVPEMREVKKTVWVVKCEEFCPTLPGCGHGGCCGCKDCGGCREACGEGCCEAGCGPTPCHVPPKCGHVRCRKILEKKEITCKVPSFKCVPVYACSGCYQACCAEAEQAAAAARDIAPAPAPLPKTPTAPKAPAAPKPTK